MTHIKELLRQHPRLTNFLVLAVGMVVIMLLATQGKDLTPGQRAWLVFASIGLAGACAWIIGWEQ